MLWLSTETNAHVLSKVTYDIWHAHTGAREKIPFLGLYFSATRNLTGRTGALQGNSGKSAFGKWTKLWTGSLCFMSLMKATLLYVHLRNITGGLALKSPQPPLQSTSAWLLEQSSLYMKRAVSIRIRSMIDDKHWNIPFAFLWPSFESFLQRLCFSVTYVDLFWW